MFLIVPGHQPMSLASLGSSTLVGKHFMILSVRLVPGLTVLSTEAVKRSENECRWHFWVWQQYDASDDSWGTRGEGMNTGLRETVLGKSFQEYFFPASQLHPPTPTFITYCKWWNLSRLGGEERWYVWMLLAGGESALDHLHLCKLILSLFASKWVAKMNINKAR